MVAGIEPAMSESKSDALSAWRYHNMKRVMGIEPTYPAWKAGILPLNYTRDYQFFTFYSRDVESSVVVVVAVRICGIHITFEDERHLKSTVAPAVSMDYLKLKNLPRKLLMLESL